MHSYHVYIDENGDAAGNYTVIARGTHRNNHNETVLGLLPVGTFSHKTNNRSSEALPVSNPTRYLAAFLIKVTVAFLCLRYRSR